MPFHFANVLIFSGLAVFFVLGSLVAGRFLRPHYPTAEKSMIYECGEKPVQQVRMRRECPRRARPLAPRPRLRARPCQAQTRENVHGEPR